MPRITPLAFLLAALVQTVGAQTPRSMTTDDGLALINVGNAVIAPDGQWVLYSTSALDWDENKRRTTWHRVPAAGGASFQYIGDAGGSDFAFSPDGRYLAFRREVDGKQQLFRMRTAGGEATQWSHHKTSVGSFRWTADGNVVYFVAVEPRSEAEEKEHKKGADAIFVDEGPNGQTADRWQNLWTLALADTAATRVTEEEFRLSSFDVAPDGHRIVYVARRENLRNGQNRAEIYLLDRRDSSVTQLTRNNAPEGGVQWAPDGRSIAYRAVSDGEWEQNESKIWVVEPATRQRRVVSAAFEGSIGLVVWAPDAQSLYFGGRQGTNTNLYRVEIDDGTVHQLTDVSGTLRVRSFSRDRSRVAYTLDDFDSPADLYVTRTDVYAPIRLTTANPGLDTTFALATGRVTRWRSRDGLDIEGVVFLPAGYEAGTRLPLLLHVHGGPAGAFTNSFRSSYHVWAGLGYAQLLPNVRGSSGYGDAFLQGNRRDIGGGDYRDLMSGVDHVIAAEIADPDQLGIRGWSYGGILGGWTITQTDRFKGASLGAMVSDWTSEYGPGFNHDVRLWYIGGTPWENAEQWRAMSPLTHVANVTTPTLLLHGINDRTDTEAQSMMFFTAIRDQGKTARYIRFPRERHGFREPRHQRTRDLEEIRWIQRHVRGIEWTPWERPAADTSKTMNVTPS